MYIEKYWEVSVGGSDDCYTFLEYLGAKQKEEITVTEIFEESGIVKLQGDFRQTDVELGFMVEDFEMELHYAIDIIAVLAALLLECKVNGSVNLQELDEMNDDFAMKLTATEQEHAMINDALKDFAANASEYDIAEMMMEDELQEMAEGCEELRKELYE
ncbi:MAG: imm68 putative immunity domain-containing protein [Eubacteriales bacterium]|nr:imm68 putative immunity domain-containing protein [Eubacteriales bacterium]